MFPQSRSPQGIPAQSSNFKPTPETLRNQKKSPTGPQKSPKIGPNVTWKTWKSETKWKPQYLQCFQHIQVADPSAISSLKSQKNQPWNQYCNLVQTSLDKSQNWSQTGSQEDPKIHQEIIKIHIWTPRCPARCPPGPQDHQNGVPGTQNGALRYPKWLV